MKKILLAASLVVALCSCQESLEERAAREANDFTRKNCPVKISDVLTTDSLVFDKATHTLHYCLSVSGSADTTVIRKDVLRADMVKSLKSNTAIRNYKDAGYTFKYTFFSTKHRGMVLCEVIITNKDYSQPSVAPHEEDKTK